MYQSLYLKKKKNIINRSSNSNYEYYVKVFHRVFINLSTTR